MHSISKLYRAPFILRKGWVRETVVKKRLMCKMTSSSGSPIEDMTSSMTAGFRGPIVVQDFTLLDDLSHLSRERIPERFAHAKGAGAFGYFEVTDDITYYSKAALFSYVGKKTDVVVRFSMAIGDKGSADSSRDVRGFAIKHFTEEGNWDMTGNNTPVYFIRDPMLFTSMLHALKRNPKTNLRDPNMIWDFLTLRAESTHQVMLMFLDRGIPDGYRYMNGYGGHAFKLVNRNGEAVYCKFHYKSDQGAKNLDPEVAAKLASENPDYATADLYNAIYGGNYPSWTMSIQIMTFQQAADCKFNPFDLTKVWPQNDYPLIRVGKVVLNRNPKNYFADVEMAAFGPHHLVPGIEPSPDKMLQARFFSYSDSHRYRLGVNYQQLPVNKPRVKVSNIQRDGAAAFDNQGDAPNYYPCSFGGLSVVPGTGYSKFQASGDVARYNTDEDDNFSQPTTLWKVLSVKDRNRLIENIAGSLKLASKVIQDRGVANFVKVDAKFGEQIRMKL